MSVITCHFTAMCPKKTADKPLWVFTLCAVPGLFCYCSATQSLDAFHTHCCCCCNEQFVDWVQKSVWWWRKSRCWKTLPFLSSWGYGQKATARGCVMSHPLAFSERFLGTPQLVLSAFLAISTMFDPIISCISAGRVIFSCLLTISQVPQAGAGFSDLRLFAEAWQ